MRSWRRYPNCASPDDAFTVSHRSSHRASRRPRGRVLHVAHNGRLFFAARAPSSLSCHVLQQPQQHAPRGLDACAHAAAH